MKSGDINEIKSLLLNIDAKINHIEDISADHRSIIIKLVKQSNAIVKFLSTLDIQMEDLTEEYTTKLPKLPSLKENSTDPSNQITDVKDLIEEYMSRFEDLEDFEEELQKNKDQLTPGTVGES
jgi:chromosome segregation ATPase|tara:strand:- start:270 stop:638 length:369 start_codon:yes stop_codon:yes gene_type:complete